MKCKSAGTVVLFTKQLTFPLGTIHRTREIQSVFLLSRTGQRHTHRRTSRWLTLPFPTVQQDRHHHILQTWNLPLRSARRGKHRHTQTPESHRGRSDQRHITSSLLLLRHLDCHCICRRDKLNTCRLQHLVHQPNTLQRCSVTELPQF